MSLSDARSVILTPLKMECSISWGRLARIAIPNMYTQRHRSGIEKLGYVSLVRFWQKKTSLMLQRSELTMRGGQLR